MLINDPDLLETIPLETTQAKEYRAIKIAEDFHNAPERFKLLIWGVRSGKTKGGAHDLSRFGLAIPRSFNWYIAPTYPMLQVTERELMDVLHPIDGINCLVDFRRKDHEFLLRCGSMLQGRSTEYPDGLRGPTITGKVLCDEASQYKEEAWHIIRQRVSTHKAGVIFASTPKGKNWLYNLACESGMPHDQPYGIFRKGEYYVSHYPTWAFPWVDHKEIVDARRGMARQFFEQEYGAKFMTFDQTVFGSARDCFCFEQPYGPDALKGASTLLGLDVAKFQDWTFVVVMDNQGRVLYVERWQKLAWEVTEAKVIELARRWNSTIMIDRANVGSMLADALRAKGMRIEGVDMNSATVKENMIVSLIVAIEQKVIKLIPPQASWATTAAKILVEELDNYEASLTPSGRIHYEAATGFHDDGVVSLGLANLGRKNGLAGGYAVSSVMVPSPKIGTPRNSLTLPRYNRLFGGAGKKSLFGRR